MSTADIQLSVVFGGQYSFEKLQSDYEQTDILARDYIKNKPDLVNFEAKTVTAETVIFDENQTGELGALKLQYSPDEKTLEFGLADGGKLQIGKEMFEEYTNIDTVPLTNGMIVSTAAIPGNRKGIKRTDFTNLTSIRSIVGMVTVASIATNQSGRVTTKGIINDLNTNGWAEGSQLWGNPAVLGGWSGNKPAKPQYDVQIGQVVVASATVGSVELNVAKDVKFSDLADVNGSTSSIDNADTIPKRDADGIIREITVADIKADFKTDTDALYEPLLGFTPENTANKGQANGYASLGADGLVPSNQLPSFVDDVLEFANLAAFPAVGETGKIYVALDTNKTYRWSGSAYIYITSGAVDSVVGKTGVVTLVKGDVGLGNVDNTSDANKPVSTAQQNALDLKIDKTLLTEITTVADNETMAVKASDSIWKRITWANIKATLKTYFETLFVTLTGAQNIAGVKTFTDSPVVPTPVNNTDAANKAYVQSVITVGNDTYQENKLITDARVASLENVINSANINQETTATVTGVDTVALPKTAANTGMQVQMFGQSAQNLVVNGDFRDGTTGWSALTFSQFTVTNKIATIVADSANDTLASEPVIPISGRKYYVCASVKSTSNLVRLNNYAGNSTSVFHSGSGNYERLSFLTSVLNTGATRIGVTDTRTSGWDAVYCTNFTLIDLTATFGAGNEPTQAQCDLLFANYFEGSDNVHGTGRVRSVGKNLFDKNRVGIGGISNTSGITAPSLTNYRYTDYIPVIAGSQYRQNADTAGSASLGAAFYDSTKSFISGVLVASPSGRTITIPANAKYIRTCWYVVQKSSDEFQIEKGAAETTYESHKPSSLYLTTHELRSNGLIKDEIRKGTNGYELVKRVGVGTLGSELIVNGGFNVDSNWTKGVDPTSGNNWTIAAGVARYTSLAITGAPVFLTQAKTITAGKKYLIQFSITASSTARCGVLFGASEVIAFNNYATGNYKFVVLAPANAVNAIFSASQVSASFDTDNFSLKEITTSDVFTSQSVPTILGDSVTFTLATPTITPIAHAGLLNSNSNGTAYFEPIIADAGVYASNLAIQLTDYPIASFESIRKYANGTYTELNTATAVIVSGGLSFTHPDLVSGDLVMFTYAYNKESIGRSMTLTHYDSRFVIADTANSKVYRWRITSTNGVASIALTEV